jgi:hypothetical protein
MKHKRLLLLLLCALFLFSLLACEVSGSVVITVVAPTQAPPGPRAHRLSLGRTAHQPACHLDAKTLPRRHIPLDF